MGHSSQDYFIGRLMRTAAMFILLLFSYLIATSTSVKLVGVMTHSGSGHCSPLDYCGMDPPNYITLKLEGMGASCETNHLDSAENDFEDGGINIFQGSCLGECRSKEFPFFPAKASICHHAGDDGWCAGSVELFFDDGQRKYHSLGGACLDDWNCFQWEV